MKKGKGEEFQKGKGKGRKRRKILNGEGKESSRGRTFEGKKKV